MPPTGVISFLHPLGVEKIWGVGPATASALHKIGLRTVSDIAHTPRSVSYTHLDVYKRQG